MKTSENGVNLIKSFEGFRSSAYKAVSTEKYYTIGYGHYGADVKAGQTITREEAERLLRSDLERFEKHVQTYDSIYNFNQNEFDALVSFAYNIGNIRNLTKTGSRSKAEIASAFTLYVRSGGKVLEGLKTRREKEKQLFLKAPDSSAEKEFIGLPPRGYYQKGDGKVRLTNYKTQIKRIQTALRNMGYDQDVTGYYGVKTVANVQKVQLENGIYVTGCTNKSTATVLNKYL